MFLLLLQGSKKNWRPAETGTVSDDITINEHKKLKKANEIRILRTFFGFVELRNLLPPWAPDASTIVTDIECVISNC